MCATWFIYLLPLSLATTTFQIQTWGTMPPPPSRTLEISVDDGTYVEIIRQRRECIYAHTIIRMIHGQFSMNWNEDLAYEAEKWAIHLAANVGHLKHSNFKFSNGSFYGENLFYTTGAEEPTRCHMAVHRWYSEINNYNFHSPNETHGVTGHFKQLVWRTSTQVGIGVAYNRRTLTTYIVARYTSPALIVGKFDISHYVKRMMPGTEIPSKEELFPSWARTPLGIGVKVKNNQTNLKDKPCKDKKDCSYYVSQGDCEKPIYKNYMMDNCYKSCTKCKPGLPIDGGWTSWNEVSECSVSCGEGVKLWYRYCIDPFPDYGGKDCIGDNMKTEACNTQECPNEDKDFTDINSSCEPYSKMGFCYAGEYKQWMQQECKKSCHQYMKDFWMTKSE